MTTSAWITLALVWTVVIGFTARFFLKVLRTPPRPEDPAPSSELNGSEPSAPAGRPVSGPDGSGTS